MIVPRLRLMPHLVELQHQLAFECDYAREAQSQMFHRAKMSHLKSLYIPEVYPGLCSDRILVSEYMEGMKLDEACRSGTQAQKIYGVKPSLNIQSQLVATVILTLTLIQGNLLFQEGRLVYFDFGSVREWEANVADSWNYLIMSCLLGKPELVLIAFSGFQNTGVTNKNAKNLVSVFTESSFQEVGQFLVSKPFQLKVLKKQMMELANIVRAKRNGFNMPKEFLFGTRAYFGHLSVVISLGSQADWFELANVVMKPWSDRNL
jgi:predicted unusual protein kinase regulating ubiquinone biosynthesis (AarF/ABC1/UbiB family)